MVSLYKNVALLQLNIQAGIDEYYLAKNVDWQDKKIDKIVLVAPQQLGMKSPVDGTTDVLTSSDIDSLYFDLYDREDHMLCNGMSHKCLLHTNNHPFIVNSELQLNLCRAYFTNQNNLSGCILLYVFYDTKQEYDYDEPQRSLTIQFPLAANEEITFTRLINTYIHAPNKRVKGIAFWDANNNPAYVTLRDHNNTYTIHDLASIICRPQMVGADAEHTQVHPLYLDDIDIDFDNSYIRNAKNATSVQTMEIKY